MSTQNLGAVYLCKEGASHFQGENEVSPRVHGQPRERRGVQENYRAFARTNSSGKKIRIGCLAFS